MSEEVAALHDRWVDPPLPACASIACSHCPRPGKCCEVLGLSINMETALEFSAFMASVQQTGDTYGAPFMPLLRNKKGFWFAWCPNLGKDGRCMDYANRPWTCRTYQPAMDRSCVLYVPTKACERIWPEQEAS